MRKLNYFKIKLNLLNYYFGIYLPVSTENVDVSVEYAGEIFTNKVGFLKVRSLA